MLWLAPLAGSVHGQATRLNLGSRPYARFLTTANRWALIAGLLMILAWPASLISGPAMADDLLDAGLHAVGLGLATTLILGISRLLAPAFAIERTASGSHSSTAGLIWIGMFLATALRVLAAIGQSQLPTVWQEALLASSGTLAWSALALFAWGLLRATIRQDRIKADLIGAARASRLGP